MRYEGANGLFVETPDVWTVEHYSVYNEGYLKFIETLNALGIEEYQIWRPKCAGAVELIRQGFVTTNLPELEDLDNVDFESGHLDLVGLLQTLIANPMLECVNVPFGLSPVSAIGTTAEEPPTDDT